jgi:hypothetical protein
MSKLADRIRKATHPEPAHLGFAAPAARQKSASLLVVARLSAGDAGKAADAVKKGADAVIVDGLEAGKARTWRARPMARAGRPSREGGSW